jgi:hypothetical protein
VYDADVAAGFGAELAIPVHDTRYPQRTGSRERLRDKLKSRYIDVNKGWWNGLGRFLPICRASIQVAL